VASYNVDDRGNYCVCSFGGMKQCKTEYSKICLSYTFTIHYNKPWRHTGGIGGTALTLSLTSALYIDGWSTPRPGRFTPGKQKKYPSYGRLGGPRGLSGWPQKMSPIPRFEPWTVQIVTISYTDYAIPANISPPQIFCKLNWGRTQTSAMTGQQSAIWPMALHQQFIIVWYNASYDKTHTELLHFTFTWPCCIVTIFFIIKPTRCTNFTNLFCLETIHDSDSSSVHHQEFIHCTLNRGVCHTGL
jgi:hypothetical protein